MRRGRGSCAQREPRLPLALGPSAHIRPGLPPHRSTPGPRRSTDRKHPLAGLMIRAATSELLQQADLDIAEVERVVTTALAEDLGDRGDLTSAATIPADAGLTGAYVSRE